MPKLPANFTIRPSEVAIQALQENWSWLFGRTLKPCLFTSMGDAFLEDSSGQIHWLSTEAGKLMLVASSRSDFEEKLSENVQDWFSVPILERAEASGLTLLPGQCFGFKRLPVLGGSYSPENVAPIEVAQWYGFTGETHRKIHDLPDGAQVEFLWE